jgi:ATP-dependent DNA ligase
VSRKDFLKIEAALEPDTPPMEARHEARLPDGEVWQFEPKWDGFRCMVFRDGNRVELRAKSGKSLGRFFPEVLTLARRLEPDRFILDGELVIELNSAPSFDALQLRLHPAESRIQRLSLETPANLVLFDILSEGGRMLLSEPLRRRRAALEAFFHRNRQPGAGQLRLSLATLDRSVAEGWLSTSGGRIDGVIAKRLDEPYRPGQRAMIKVKMCFGVE